MRRRGWLQHFAGVAGLAALLTHCSSSSGPESMGAAEAGANGDDQGGHGETNTAGTDASGAHGGTSSVVAGEAAGGNETPGGGLPAGGSSALSAAAGEAGQAGAAGSPGASELLCEPAPYCKTNAGCAWYEHCVAERCVAAPEGEPCTDFSLAPSGLVPDGVSCGNAQYCHEGVCANRPLYVPDVSDCLGKPAEGLCPQGSECSWRPLYDPEMTCRFRDDGVVGRRCDDIGCDHQFYCDYSNSFPPDHSPPICAKRGNLGDACNYFHQESCASGLVCNFSRCQAAEAPAGSPCQPYLYELYPDLDERPVELDPQIPRACAKGLYCKDTGEVSPDLDILGECVPTKAVGSSCEADWQCSNGYCDSTSHCAAPALNTPCGCDGVCWYTNGACPDGSRCAIGDGAPTTCLPLIAFGEPCRAGAACPVGGECVYSGPGAPICTRIADQGEDCTGAKCVTGTACVTMPRP